MGAADPPISIAILGAGAWGTALAQAAARNGARVRLWAREEAVRHTIADDRENRAFLPGVILDPAIEPAAALADLAAAAAILLVAPAQYSAALVGELVGHLTRPTPLVICAKGIERTTGRLMSEMLADVAPGHPIAVLSGPTFAREVALGLPTAVTLAAAREDTLAPVIAALGQPTFRPYVSTDLVGAQIGGAVKNVLAIACGMVAGLGLGENARAAVITRGMAEMQRFGRHYGARPETLMGLSGLGDLILTCSSTQSRNFSLGKALGEGADRAALLRDRTTVAEGAATATVLARLAAQAGIDMPITGAVAAVIDEAAAVRDIMTDLMQRPFRREAG